MVVGFGLINKDFVAVVPTWERDTKVRATHYFEQVGGPVPVALTAVAKLGGLACVHLGVVGDDRDADDLARSLDEQGVSSDFQRTPGVATSRSLVLLDAHDGSRTLANYAEELPLMTFTPAHDELLSQASLLHLDGRDLGGALHAAQLVKAAGGHVSFDLGTMRPGREALFPLCDIILASKGGGAGAFPEHANNPAAQVRSFLAAGVKVAGVTLAEKGVMIATKEQPDPVFLPAFGVPNVLDTCGAGDVFHGAFCWAYATGVLPHAAADFAQATVALRIQNYGNRAGLPDRATVEAFLKKVRP
ncbi:carbohydrate kinase family protein [Armatimonas sp.]|uniref:carbohydrate kinase family protein n=1 Tax=Armatimonas sp. TaxID=1872638 RepID=UPI00375136EF